MKQLEFEYSIREDPNLRLRAKAASDLFIHKYATKEDVKKVLRGRVPSDFAEARQILSKSELYSSIRPETVVEIIQNE